MAKQLFIGNLSYNATEEAVRDLFAQFGEVTSVKIITDKFTSAPKGFGFVEMEGHENAITNLHNYEFLGRNLVVSEARERSADDRPRRPSNGGGNGGGGGGGSWGNRRPGGGGGNSRGGSGGRPQRRENRSWN
jgi:RNA recognition motif-containing protein